MKKGLKTIIIIAAVLIVLFIACTVYVSDYYRAKESVLSLYGREDTVLNREKYDENLTNLPNNFTEVVIEGGCHAYFGTYGAQKGDGVPKISNEEQIEYTADIISDFVG